MTITTWLSVFLLFFGFLSAYIYGVHEPAHYFSAKAMGFEANYDYRNWQFPRVTSPDVQSGTQLQQMLFLTMPYFIDVIFLLLLHFSLSVSRNKRAFLAILPSADITVNLILSLKPEQNDFRNIMNLPQGTTVVIFCVFFVSWFWWKNKDCLRNVLKFLIGSSMKSAKQHV